jgi:hypothetical protein
MENNEAHHHPPTKIVCTLVQSSMSLYLHYFHCCFVPCCCSSSCCFSIPCFLSTKCCCSLPCYLSTFFCCSFCFLLNCSLISQAIYLVTTHFSWYPLFLTILYHSTSSFSSLRSAIQSIGRKSGGLILNPIQLVFIFLRVYLYHGVLRRERCKLFGE